MVFITSFNALVWLGTMAISLWAVLGWSGFGWQVYEGVELLYFFAGYFPFPYVVPKGLTYNIDSHSCSIWRTRVQFIHG